MASRSSIQLPQSKSATSLVSTGLATLAEPPTRQVDGAMMDYFLIEVVNALRASAAVATARAKEIEKEMVDSGLIPPPPPPPPSLPLKKDVARDSMVSLTSRTSSPAGKLSAMDEEEEAVFVRLEAIGMHVGANVAER